MIRKILESIQELELQPARGFKRGDDLPSGTIGEYAKDLGIMGWVLVDTTKNQGGGNDYVFQSPELGRGLSIVLASDSEYPEEPTRMTLTHGTGTVMWEEPTENDLFSVEGAVEKALDASGKYSGQWVDEFGSRYMVPKEVSEHPLMKEMSWHNDVSPSFGESDDDAEREVRLWVAHPVGHMREVANTRYGVYYTDQDGTGDDGVETDDVNEAIKAWEQRFDKYFGGQSGQE